jgi:hypothetical protein
MQSENEPPPGYRDVSIPIEALTVPGLVIGVGLALLAIAPYWVIHGFKESLTLSVGAAVGLILALIGLLVAHELLHALGWMIAGRLGRDQISFGLDRKTLNPYTHVHVPMTARAYRFGAALPGILTGLLPTLAGWVIGSGPLTLLGAFMSIGAVGDLIILWVIRRVPGHTLVIDHPTRAGCWVSTQDRGSEARFK